MPAFDYLIVGAGMTAAAAARGIREGNSTGSIGMIGAEPHPPYARPPLSKALWKGAAPETIWLGAQATGAELHLGRTVRALNARERTVSDDRGEVYSYGKLLLATGGTPRRLNFGGDAVTYFRTLDDYQRLRGLVAPGRRFAVLGGGFIGSEIAAALALNGASVSLLFPGTGIGSHMFPQDLAGFLNDYYREKGVAVLAGEEATGLTAHGESVAVVTRGGREVAADHVVAGLGIQPNTELARSAGLDVANGVIVDESLRTSDPHIFAAGDVAEFFNPALGKRLRVEHEDNANTMGLMAGRAMTGQSVRYDYLPSFYSDLFDLGYEAVGELDARLETVPDWKQPFQEGVVYYLRDERVRGVLLWNVWGKVDAARQLIAAAGPFRPGDLKGRL